MTSSWLKENACESKDLAVIISLLGGWIDSRKKSITCWCYLWGKGEHKFPFKQIIVG